VSKQVNLSTVFVMAAALVIVALMPLALFFIMCWVHERKLRENQVHEAMEELDDEWFAWQEFEDDDDDDWGDML
jgi:hypothetical protein